jgi:hypothetical protein
MAGDQTETPAPNGRPVDAAAERESILAELRAQPKKAAAPPSAEEKPAEAEEVEAVVEETTDEPEGDTPVEDDAADVEDEPKPDAEAKSTPEDPTIAKRLDKVQKAEKRAKEELAREKASLHADIDQRVKKIESEWAPRVEKAEKFEPLAPQIDIDPLAVLDHLGLKPERYEHLAKVLYTLSKAKDDPKAREAAAELLQKRQQLSRVEQLEKELREMKDAQTKRAAEEKATRDAAAYLSTIETAAKADTSEAPLARHFLAKSPEKTRERLAQVAMALLEETGEKPDADDVLAEYERIRRAELDELGVDVDALLKAQPKKQTKTAEEKRTAKTLGNDLSTKTQVPRSAAKSDDELREETLRELAAMRSAGNAG